MQAGTVVHLLARTGVRMQDKQECTCKLGREWACKLECESACKLRLECACKQGLECHCPYPRNFTTAVMHSTEVDLSKKKSKKPASGRNWDGYGS